MQTPVKQLNVNAPFPLESYLVSGLPAVPPSGSALIFVANEAGGSIPAFSDGVDWRRVSDRVIVS